MADQLNWLNQHLLLLRYKTVEEMQKNENYELPDAAAGLSSKNGSLEAFLAELAEHEMYAEACGCLAYAMHKRAAVWWGYNVLLQLTEEPPPAPEKPEEPEDAEEPEEPDKQPENEPEKTEQDASGTAETMAAVNAAFEKVKNLGAQAGVPGVSPDAVLAEAENAIHETLAKIDAHLEAQPQDVKDALREIQTGIDNIYRQNTGLTQDEYWDKIASLSYPGDDGESTALEDSLAENAASMEAENAAFEKVMEAQFPPPDPKLLRLRTEEAMRSVHAWCLTPDAENSVAALNAGNAIEDQPAGTLAQAAFWSYGDLAIDGSADCVVKTPPGLAASGVGIVIMQAIASEGGSLSPKERGAAYWRLGLEIAQGKNNWSANTAAEPEKNQKITQEEPGEEPVEYEKWNG